MKSDKQINRAGEELIEITKNEDETVCIKILIAALLEIKINEEEIIEIVVLKAKAGIYPYMFNGAVNKMDGTLVLYR